MLQPVGLGFKTPPANATPAFRPDRRLGDRIRRFGLDRAFDRHRQALAINAVVSLGRTRPLQQG